MIVTRTNVGDKKYVYIILVYMFLRPKRRWEDNIRIKMGPKNCQFSIFLYPVVCQMLHDNFVPKNTEKTHVREHI